MSRHCGGINLEDRERSQMTSSSQGGGGGQPKVTDGKLYCYFVRKIWQKDDGGEGGDQTFPKIG